SGAHAETSGARVSCGQGRTSVVARASHDACEIPPMNPRVLLVGAAAILHARALELAGHQVARAGDVDEALRALAAEPFDLVGFDALAQDARGAPLAERLIDDERRRDRGRALGLVALLPPSAVGAPELASRALAAGVDELVADVSRSELVVARVAR